jgi:hypothetical protein
MRPIYHYNILYILSLMTMEIRFCRQHHIGIFLIEDKHLGNHHLDLHLGNHHLDLHLGNHHLDLHLVNFLLELNLVDILVD